jgi:hypothetical protein
MRRLSRTVALIGVAAVASVALLFAGSHVSTSTDLMVVLTPFRVTGNYPPSGCKLCVCVCHGDLA